MSAAQRDAWWHYEHRSRPLLPRKIFLRRLLAHGGAAVVIVVFALAAGILGYRMTEHMPWIDAFLNASMILGGMGPVGELHTVAGKLFAGVYALFSGVLFLVASGVLFAPIVHRFLHRLHAQDEAPSR
jgi:hypothetical protein